MKVEQAREVASKAIEQLSQALEAGHTEKLQEYLAAMARFHRYSLHNILLIASQRPNATHVAGFQTWKELGRFVKKGAKGILILAPMKLRTETKPEDQDDESERSILRFRAVYVFDVADTDGKPLAELGRADGDPSGHTERLKEFIAGRGITLEYSDAITPALGQCSPGKIVPLPANRRPRNLRPSPMKRLMPCFTPRTGAARRRSTSVKQRRNRWRLLSASRSASGPGVPPTTTLFRRQRHDCPVTRPYPAREFRDSRCHHGARLVNSRAGGLVRRASRLSGLLQHREILVRDRLRFARRGCSAEFRPYARTPTAALGNLIETFAQGKLAGNKYKATPATSPENSQNGIILPPD
jgi:hypothetical protein